MNYAFEKEARYVEGGRQPIAEDVAHVEAGHVHGEDERRLCAPGARHDLVYEGFAAGIDVPMK
jgi:hypothetical protein